MNPGLARRRAAGSARAASSQHFANHNCRSVGRQADKFAAQRP